MDSVTRKADEFIEKPKKTREIGSVNRVIESLRGKISDPMMELLRLRKLVKRPKFSMRKIGVKERETN
jgi:hypothetical protein